MSATFWTYDEMVRHIEEHDSRDILHFRIVTAKLGIDLIKLPTTNEAFVENQIVYRKVDGLNGSKYERKWEMASRYLELYDVLTTMFKKWWNSNFLPEITSTHGGEF